ncbi:sel1 repeat family protein [Oxalobacteraceae bacterium]|nr:sel1 repeat family protein [Oxalobacteraceae bacterium]
MTALATGAFLFNDYLQERALHALPYGFKKFSLSDPLPACARWKEHMPATREPTMYQLYFEARKLWRSKIEWQLTRDEATRILTDVRKAADLGDWGARALLAHFYLEGLGPLESNSVLEPDPYKAVEIASMAAKAMQPWGLYDLGVAYEHGYGGAHYDVDLAWAYYLKAAELGSPEAQMALAQAYADAGRLNDEETMLQCAYQQGHGAAAYALGIDREASKKDFRAAMRLFQDGVKFGNQDCANSLYLLFDWETNSDRDRKLLGELGIVEDHDRSLRYRAISDALQINPDLKLSRLDFVLPLPPAKLPAWAGVDDAVEPTSNGPPTY